MPRFSAVLFDFGHTLFDTPSSVEFLLSEASRSGVVLERADVAKAWSEARNRSRTAEEMAKGRDLSTALHRRCWTELFAPIDALAPGLAPALGARLYDHEVSPAGWLPYPDARPTLVELRASGVRIGVVSDTGWDIRPVFVHHGLADLVEVFVLSFEHGVTKPSPKLFHAACEQLGVRPDETLMVGDNHRNDGGAAESGLTVLVLPLTEHGAPRGLDVVLRMIDRR